MSEETTEQPKKRGRPPKAKPVEEPVQATESVDEGRPGTAPPVGRGKTLRRFKFKQDTNAVTHNFVGGKVYEINMSDGDWKRFVEQWNPTVVK